MWLDLRQDIDKSESLAIGKTVVFSLSSKRSDNHNRISINLIRENYVPKAQSRYIFWCLSTQNPIQKKNCLINSRKTWLFFGLFSIVYAAYLLAISWPIAPFGPTPLTIWSTTTIKSYLCFDFDFSCRFHFPCFELWLCFYQSPNATSLV